MEGIKSQTARSNGKNNHSTNNGIKKNKKVKDRPASHLLFSGSEANQSDWLGKELLTVLVEVKNGNFNVRMPIDQTGISGKICDTLNDIIALNEKLMFEFTKAGNAIGKQGKLTQRIDIANAKGSWGNGIDAL